MSSSPIDPQDRARLDHMRRSAVDARTILGDMDAASLAADMVRSRALVNCFTEIGEAAARLSPAGRTAVGDQPWRQIVGMRNIVVHVYWGIDLAELVMTTKTDLPELIRAIDAALA